MNTAVLAVGVAFFMAAASGFPARTDAFLFHATQKALAKRIMKKGFSQAKMRASARFGRGVYASTKRKTALAESPGAKTTVRLRESKYLKRNGVDLSRPTPAKLRRVVGNMDLRGTVKKGIIGPKLGHSLGTAAGRKGKVIKYRSARDPRGGNIHIPKSVYEAHPRIVRPDAISGQR